MPAAVAQLCLVPAANHNGVPEAANSSLLNVALFVTCPRCAGCCTQSRVRAGAASKGEQLLSKYSDPLLSAVVIGGLLLKPVKSFQPNFS